MIGLQVQYSRWRKTLRTTSVALEERNKNRGGAAVFRNESEIYLEKIGPLLSTTMFSKTDSCRLTKQEDIVLELKTILDIREWFYILRRPTFSL